MTSSATFRTWSRRLAIGAGLLVYSLVFAEVFIRLFAPQALMPRYVTGSAWGVRTNIPGAHYRHETPDVSVSYAINTQGMRDDRDHPLAKPAGMCRVALLGDSYTVGYELALEQTFAHRLEALLRERHANVEVLNFGVSGFGTAESLQQYERRVRQFSPDVVMLQWQVTDFDDNSRAGLFALENGALVRRSDSYLPGVTIQDRLMQWSAYRLLADHSHLFNFAREQVGWQGKRLLALVAKRRPADPLPADAQRDAVVQVAGYAVTPAQIALSAALLDRMHDRVIADGAAFHVFDIPNRTPPDFGSSYDLMPAEVREALPAISPLAAFRASRRPVFFENGAKHLTPAGADLMARAMADAIERAGDLSGCGRQPIGASGAAEQQGDAAAKAEPADPRQDRNRI